ncbi:single-stranded DNA-binding protein [Catellatospora methionotrophica]|uniref:Single-stranded DNA-binding protein n=1 Tax=Catellatospora methionotrophica TaxID=121620 RepID=A0A8J3PFZ5_9ACTN|nr:single-stranded DNA-binding protein [Catellatospora methionotrophica]GIG13751.1 single-stranded DNA-binding protein [Catellatospora methionotrophica]
MANETVLTLVGNLTADPELRFTPTGAALCRFSVASTPRQFDKGTGAWTDGAPLYMNCTVWRDMAENVANSLVKGSRVVVTGRLKLNQWTTPEGDKRQGFQLDVDDVGASLRYATAQVKKLTRSAGQPPAVGEDAWASDNGGDEPPF